MKRNKIVGKLEDPHCVHVAENELILLELTSKLCWTLASFAFISLLKYFYRFEPQKITL